MLKFVGIGFPKCGTSFLYNQITNHPEIAENKKERHYFSQQFHQFTEKENKQYLNRFTGDKIEGEFSPGILYYPLNIKYLAKAVSNDVKFIAIVRNPIDRAHSHYKQMKNVRLHIINPRNVNHFMEQSVYPEALYSGLYNFAFMQASKYIDLNKCLIIQYEKLCIQFNMEMNKIFKFLNLDTINLKDKSGSPTKYNSFRKELKEFYEEDVNKFFTNFDAINKYTDLNQQLWEDFV